MNKTHRTITCQALAIICLAAVSSIALAQSEPLVRQTTHGAVEGLAVESMIEDQPMQSYAWLGIPFASPPVGELRWKAPRPPGSWEGVREAKSLPEACVQYGGLMAIMDCDAIGDLVGAEDCLYLNVWRPQTDEKNLPVFFWIYGGGNTVGQAAMSLYHGANFAARGNVVFVSINYRLGPMGWFAHPALKNGDARDDSGNFGTLDVARALEWVRDNAEAFGGDPGNVTIAGESAGGVNVFSMLVSPMAEGLFHRAISQSGAPLSGSMAAANKHAAEVLAKLVINDGLAATEAEARRYLADQGDGWVPGYMRGKTAAEVYACYGHGTFGTLFGADQVLVDGNVIPRNPYSSLIKGDYHQVPLLIGNNKAEAKLFLPLVMSNLTETSMCELIRDLDPENPNIDLLDYMNPLYLPIYGPMAYISGLSFQAAGGDLPAAIMSPRHQVFAYRFDWNEEPAPLDFVIGAGHGVEMPFVFGNFQQDPDSVLRFASNSQNRAGRLALSASMTAYWSNFARTGDPNGPGLATWRPYSALGIPKRKVLDSGR